jgi:sugar O-acyltransferase (sialic acid O-acetyltransferase NeuD family)
MKEEIVLIGGGGHCKACIDVIELGNKFKIAGIIDIKEKLHKRVLGYEIIGSDAELPEIVKHYNYFLITIGQTKDATRRLEVFEYVTKLGGNFPAIVSPLAYVSKHASIKEGTIIMNNVIINADARIGRNCIVNTGAIIEHDTIIEDYCHISTGCIVNGQCSVGKGTFLGTNSSLSNNISIIPYTVIGNGAVVVKSINERGIYIGNPARKVG